MKKIILSTFLSVQTIVGIAQVNPVSNGIKPNTVRSRFSAGKQDTMRALGNMYVRYARRRKAGKIWLGIGAIGGITTLRVATAGNSNTVNPNGPPGPAYTDGAIAIVGVVCAGIPLLIGITKLASASVENQDSVVARYARQQPLPASIVRRLRRKDFD